MFSLRRNKRGQFFLISAVIIIVVIVSIVTVSNYTQRKEIIKLYDLGQELGIESQNVLEYGTYSQLDENQMKDLMETFIQNYVNYIGEGKNVYFVYGNSKVINMVGYQDIVNESVEVCFETGGGGSPTGNIIKAGEHTVGANECFPYTTISQVQEFTKSEGDISVVIVRIEGIDYQFKLKAGENFYFIIWQEIGGEKHVVTNN